jgi:prevent-host-death family protein
MTKTVNVHAAKTHLSRLVEEAAAGAEIVIAKAGKPMARLVPLAPAMPGKRPLGLLAGREIPKEYYEPLPDDIIDMMYNGPIFPEDKG